MKFKLNRKTVECAKVKILNISGISSVDYSKLIGYEFYSKEIVVGESYTFKLFSEQYIKRLKKELSALTSDDTDLTYVPFTITNISDIIDTDINVLEIQSENVTLIVQLIK